MPAFISDEEVVVRGINGTTESLLRQEHSPEKTRLARIAWTRLTECITDESMLARFFYDLIPNWGMEIA